VKWNRFFLWLALLPALLFFGTGCSGINASQGFSPLSLFLPGLVQNKTNAKETEPVASLPPSGSSQTVAQSL
jgi:hypothetical protein